MGDNNNNNNKKQLGKMGMDTQKGNNLMLSHNMAQVTTIVSAS
jgi:hypothetical protein